MTRSSKPLQRGALAGLALLLCCAALGDEALREQVHNKHKHESYMLIEDPGGARLYLFDEGILVEDVSSYATPEVEAGLLKLRSADPRVRVRGLTELAGSDSYEALSAALQLLTDPSLAVREEAQSLLLDHPQGADMVAALGLVDEELEDMEE